MKFSVTPQVADLRRAKARHDRAKAEVERIAASAEQAPAAETTAATDEALAAARRAYEDAAGARALGDATDADLAQAYSRLDAAQRAANRANDDAQRTEAAVVGLARRLDAAKGERDEAAKALREAEVAWLNAELVAADREHCEAIERLGRAFGRAKAIGNAIVRRGAPCSAYLTHASVISDLPFFGIASSREDQRAEMRKAFAIDAQQAEAAVARAAQTTMNR
ncbi:MAG: hypothetical protein LT106_16720 [Burkholderiaceae bacterium]|nr:hypothetical protein [Burkholderiaceae bacterium]